MKILFLLFLFCATLSAQSKRLGILAPEGKAFKDFKEGLKETISGYEIVEIEFKDSVKALMDLQKYEWDVIVALDNPSLETVKKYEANFKGEKYPQIFAAMVLQLDQYAEEMKNLNGIRYEVPAFTIFSHLRNLSETPFSNVLVVHREIFTTYLDQAEEQLKKEKINLIRVCADCENESENQMLRKVKKVFKDQTKEKTYDLVWALADNILFSPRMVRKFWQPQLINRRVPVVVPLQSWVSPKVNFGMFNAGPDHREMGVQLGDLLIQYQEAEEEFEPSIEEMISVITTVNFTKFKRVKWKLDETEVQQVNKVFR